ncbi:rod shape-determining protein MreC [Campylobacter sp. US33a]|uniref:Rod shape-determining protein MreC n=1 Tax=Campylobacter sp. CCS1377 TaxID=3158229 RepID=A0AAU7E856_9BACT|nr:rod shape-determining protein MreC [Campylobacter sp. US33a]MCW1359882.1 rod shape-determining protein MreC [Campylobacter jejuni]TEY03944.1 rod shape-determining protein MreC [Campylobacter sp. US33a]
MKNKIRNVLILSFLVFISFYYGGVIKKNILNTNDVVITSFYDFIEYLKNKFNEHFDQADEIRNLRSENEELRKTSILVSSLSNDLNQILEDRNSSQYFPKVSLVRAISYVQVGDYKKVWLNSFIREHDRNRGLIYKGYTAGIAINKEDRLMGLLQGDEQCVFSVYIGKDRLPGLVQGQNDRAMVKFIPKWAKVQVGDEVVTSGLDEIFFPGVPVGKITKIIDEDMYQVAYIEPYAKINTPAYLYMVESF